MPEPLSLMPGPSVDGVEVRADDVTLSGCPVGVSARTLVDLRGSL